MPDRPLLLAHRGDHSAAPENSLAAIAAATARPGLHGVEFDVRHAADGTPIVLHDESLARVQGRNVAAAALTVAELRGHGVPTLAEVLAACPADTFLDIELKEAPTLATMAVIAAFRAAPAASLAAADVAGDASTPTGGLTRAGTPAGGLTRAGIPAGGLVNAVISAFEPESVAALRVLEPSWPAWLNVEGRLGGDVIALARELGCQGVSVDVALLDEAAVRLAREAGLVVAAWTVRDGPTLARVTRLGVVAACVEGDALPG